MRNFKEQKLNQIIKFLLNRTSERENTQMLNALCHSRRLREMVNFMALGLDEEDRPIKRNR